MLQSFYLPAVRSLLNDLQSQFYTDATLTSFINRARTRVAATSASIRVLALSHTVANQEVYVFPGFNALVTATPGVAEVQFVRTIAIAIGTGGWKPMWRRVPWTDFQARFRIYNGTFMGTQSEPGWWAQYGQGSAGSIYLAPIPTQVNPMEADCTCLPVNLASDTDPEAIPVQWQEAVNYWAAILALFQQQRLEDAKALGAIFQAEMPWAAAVVCPTFVSTGYPATIRSA